MDLKTKIAREKECINDLVKSVKIHTQEGDYELAEKRGQDVIKSIQHIKSLKRKVDEEFFGAEEGEEIANSNYWWVLAYILAGLFSLFIALNAYVQTQ